MTDTTIALYIFSTWEHQPYHTVIVNQRDFPTRESVKALVDAVDQASDIWTHFVDTNDNIPTNYGVCAVVYSGRPQACHLKPLGMCWVISEFWNTLEPDIADPLAAGMFLPSVAESPDLTEHIQKRFVELLDENDSKFGDSLYSTLSEGTKYDRSLFLKNFTFLADLFANKYGGTEWNNGEYTCWQELYASSSKMRYSPIEFV